MRVAIEINLNTVYAGIGFFSLRVYNINSCSRKDIFKVSILYTYGILFSIKFFAAVFNVIMF